MVKKNQKLKIEEFPNQLPILPSKEITPFPSVMMSLYLGRDVSINALDATLDNLYGDDHLVLMVAQKNLEESIKADDLFKVGVICKVIKFIKYPEGSYKVYLQGVKRALVTKYQKKKKREHFVAHIEVKPDPLEIDIDSKTEELIVDLKEKLELLSEYEHIPEELVLAASGEDDPGVLADMVAANYGLDIEVGQRILEIFDPIQRLHSTYALVKDDINRLALKEQIKELARNELSQDQREYFLREQMKQIQKELGESNGGFDDLEELSEALDRANLPPHAKKEAEKQLSRLERMPVEASEYAIFRTYLEWLSELPWAKKTKERLDLRWAKKVLEEDHYGLGKVKDRILEYLSVKKLNKNSSGPILCFVGPPGVGKTSLGKSIAKATNRKFFRFSLGGVRDEAEIRGHRRTYIGAMPGRIIQGIKQAGSKNPVFVLDELDKVGNDYRGDPASALLEVLDPHQNKEFIDHYIDIPFDLSEVMFIATANTTDTIPDALLDRLEVVDIAGYTTSEKLQIAKRHLIPRQLKQSGLSGKKIAFMDSALKYLILRYTREAGVRNLERLLASICRKIARQYAETKKLKQKITKEFIIKALGAEKYDPEIDEPKDMVGLVKGLAWTPYGGEVMPIEASVANGKGELILTGQLGQVMQESAKAALFYARANAERLGLDPNFHNLVDIHIHAPGGAIPKDGPSAGIALATAVISALSGKLVSRAVAMTGEITLRGRVLAVGGIKEKVLAAYQYGIKKIIIPFENLKDIEEVPKEQRSKLKFIPVKHIEEVLQEAIIIEGKLSNKRKIKAKSRSKGRRALS